MRIALQKSPLLVLSEALESRDSHRGLQHRLASRDLANLGPNLGGGASEIPYFTVFLEGRPQNLGGEMSPPKFTISGRMGLQRP